LMKTQHIIVKDDEPKGRRVYQTFKSDEEDIAEEVLESAEAADLEVRKFTVYTNNNIPKKNK
jgi:hypothetical protein